MFLQTYRLFCKVDLTKIIKRQKFIFLLLNQDFLQISLVGQLFSWKIVCPYKGSTIISSLPVALLRKFRDRDDIVFTPILNTL